MRHLTFAQIRLSNCERLPQFKNSRGIFSHPPLEGLPPGYDWPLSKWSNAVLGELGEAANLIKKIERGDFTLDDLIPHGHAQHGTCVTVRDWLAHELADTLTYLDLLAHRADIDLGAAYIEKFNIVSDRVGCSVKL